MHRRIPLARRLLIGRLDAGIAAVEFGLLAPLFLIVLAGAIDIGAALYTQIRLEAAIAAGANYALVHASAVNLTDAASLASNITTIVTTSNAGPAAGGTVVVNNGHADMCYCPTGPTGSPPSWTWGTAATCGTTCTGGGTAGKFITITATYSYAPYFSSYGFLPNGTISTAAMIQTQ
jgi:Flp pilus assembly protein TadG